MFVEKMGEINEWPQGKVEIQPILRWKNKAFHLPCEIEKMARKKLQPPPPYLMVAP